jgi:coenzyme F420-reducing hydrogenase delta subunit
MEENNYEEINQFDKDVGYTDFFKSTLSSIKFLKERIDMQKIDKNEKELIDMEIENIKQNLLDFKDTLIEFSENYE